MLAAAAFVSACAAPRFSDAGLAIPLVPMGSHAAAPEHFAMGEAEPSEQLPDPRKLPMFLGTTGNVVAWDDVLRAAAWADVILIGEEHDDGVGHAVQRAVMEDVAARFPGVWLSMEMLERDDQPLVEDYFDDFIDAETFAKLTHSERWAGEGSWATWYQPIIDVAKASGGRVIAANAPRRYVRMARMQGYERLRELPGDRRKLFSLPKGPLENPYRERFVALMIEMSEESDSESPHRTSREQAIAGFRSQYLWDSTMADSIARGMRDGARKVVHLVGRFHVEREGGTVIELRERTPGARILTIVMSRDDALTLRDHDRGLADIVIYTGKRPEPEEEPTDESATEPEAEEVSEESLPAQADQESQSTVHPAPPGVQ